MAESKVLLVSHGRLAEGLYESLGMLVGKVDDFSYLKLDDDGVEKFSVKFEKEITDLKEKSKNIYVLCDIKGGTPFNVAYRYKIENKCNFTILTGMNLPMLLELSLSLDQPDIENICLNAKQSIEIL